MASYMIRVVLHGATAAHYTRLHEAMRKGGAGRTVTGRNGVVFDLPDGEYVLASNVPTERVRDLVCDIAASVKATPSPSVVVVSYSDIAWQLVPFPGQS